MLQAVLYQLYQESNEKEPEGQEETIKAYDFMLSYVGMLIYQLFIQKYIPFFE